MKTPTKSVQSDARLKHSLDRSRPRGKRTPLSLAIPLSNQRADDLAPAGPQSGSYRNPILCADYPDPDVIRDSDDFYMVVSSFHCSPGLPVLHSDDLVNWRIINHAVRVLPHPRFDEVQPGCGIWAPSIRRHAGRFWIFFSMPDEGIYCTSAEHPAGDWSEPHLVQGGRGLIDPCPLWDDDGNAYLVHAYARSRCGIKHKLRVRPMAPDCSKLLGDGELIFDDPVNHPTLEGPKFLKRDGYYYILAPAGGVESGWQLALRARNIYGPYQEKIVLERGSTSVNGPHQGGLVDTPAGEWWFLHFQDIKPYGRVVHLQPARWENGWPLIGVDYDGNGVGEPVEQHPKPAIAGMTLRLRNGEPRLREMPQASDDFDSDPTVSARLGHQWHWNANHKTHWYSLTARPGWLRLFAQPEKNAAVNGSDQPDFLHTPHVLLQKFPTRDFVVETRLELGEFPARQCVGMAVMGRQYAALVLNGIDGQCQTEEFELSCVVDGQVVSSTRVPRSTVILRIAVADGICSFGFQTDVTGVRLLPTQFQAVEGFWVGAKIGLFAIQRRSLETTGANLDLNGAYADFDYLKFHPHTIGDQ